MSDFPDDIPFFADSTDEENKPSAPVGLAARAMAMRGATCEPGQELHYLEGLNPEQRQAVLALDGPVLVLAGAGTGKTRVLTTRIAHILSLGLAYPGQILAVTFTNKAAKEMKERISSLVDGMVEGMPWLGTFHAIGVKILRRHGELVGLKTNFTILDTDDVLRLLKQLIQAAGLDDKRWPPRALAHLIDGWKNHGQMPEDIAEGEAASFGNGRGRVLYRAYQDRLKSLNACDFGDLLLHPIAIFKQHADVLADYHRRFRYMLVDEYQDTNMAQYLWLRLLAQRPKGGGQGNHVNLCCVGDDDQSIYGWRGAQVDNILRFERDFPGCCVIKLERNYRSTAPILATAAHLISHNEGRLGKTLYTDQPEAQANKVRLTALWDSEEEARAVGEAIEDLQREGHKLNDMAILVRASFQMRAFEDRFVTLGLNYRVIGGPRFYERMEIRDAIAYFRLVAQGADDLAFGRIINTPKRGLGEAALRQIHDYARVHDMPLLAAAADLIHGTTLKPKPRGALKDVVENVRRWQTMLKNTPHTQLAETILDESGYTAMWQNDRSAEAPGRLENLKELIRSMEGFDSLHGFLEHVSLVMEVEREEDFDAVSLMTLHSAKGLEFDNVFLPGWEDGLFPHQRALDEGGRSGLEEERRLAYVGLTRAKKNLAIYFASNRRIHGSWQTTIPSRFLDELPQEHVEITAPDSSYGSYGRFSFAGEEPFDNNYQTPGWQRAQAYQRTIMHNEGRGSSAALAQPIFYGEAVGDAGKIIEGEIVARKRKGKTSTFSSGERVFHLKFGSGTIAFIDDDKLTVDFDKAGQKRVLDSYVEKI